MSTTMSTSMSTPASIPALLDKKLMSLSLSLSSSSSMIHEKQRSSHTEFKFFEIHLSDDLDWIFNQCGRRNSGTKPLLHCEFGVKRMICISCPNERSSYWACPNCQVVNNTFRFDLSEMANSGKYGNHKYYQCKTCPYSFRGTKRVLILIYYDKERDQDDHHHHHRRPLTYEEFGKTHQQIDDRLYPIAASTWQSITGKPLYSINEVGEYNSYWKELAFWFLQNLEAIGLFFVSLTMQDDLLPDLWEIVLQYLVVFSNLREIQIQRWKQKKIENFRDLCSGVPVLRT